MPPVFVDQRGRRRRLVVAIGTTGAVALTLAVVGLVAGFAGPSSGRLPGLPAVVPAHDSPAVQPSGGAGPTAVPSVGPALAGTTTTPPAPTAAPSSSGPLHRRIPTQTPTHPRKT